MSRKDARARGPVLLLLAGVGLGIVGVLGLSYGVIGAFSQMDRAGGPPGIFLVLQWIGLLAGVSGAAAVVLSLAWWIRMVIRR